MAPLYYAAIGLALVIAHIPPRHFFFNRIAIVVMVFFVANSSSLAAGVGPLISHLWSISIEEQFYLVWPPILKFGGKRLAPAHLSYQWLEKPFMKYKERFAVIQSRPT